jgi:hypothetical protein
VPYARVQLPDDDPGRIDPDNRFGGGRHAVPDSRVQLPIVDACRHDSHDGAGLWFKPQSGDTGEHSGCLDAFVRQRLWLVAQPGDPGDHPRCHDPHFGGELWLVA